MPQTYHEPRGTLNRFFQPENRVPLFPVHVERRPVGFFSVMERLPYPLFFAPVYKSYVWGGRRIRSQFRRAAAPAVCAESWEICDRPEGMSVVRNGPLAGASLRELVEHMGADLLGRDSGGAPFPLLLKIIDAARKLSVQVHPDSRAAALFGGEPKTEMWYVLDADPGACVFAGLKPGTGRRQFEAALRKERVAEVLKRVPVRRGQAVFVPAGRVHAIGEGCLLLEIQQNSDTTYRLYDWGRVGADGRPRPLHLREGMDSIRWLHRGEALVRPVPRSRDGRDMDFRVPDRSFFRVSRLQVNRPRRLRNDGRSWRVLFSARGETRVEANGMSETAAEGTSCLLPAALRSCTLAPLRGVSTLLLIAAGPGALSARPNRRERTQKPAS
jgi:mannose-6-phosphate isomerase